MPASACIVAAYLFAAPQTVLQEFVAPTQTAKQEDLDRIASKQTELNAILARLRQQPAASALIADVEIYAKAAEWIVRHGEFYTDKFAGWTVEGLDRGIRRAQELERQAPSWIEQTGRFSRGFVSRVDGSAQPYGLVIPAGYGQDPDRKWRLDVELHGRGSTLNEVSFLHAHDSNVPVPADQDFIQLDVFGRTNNAYRWAGETDVFEAVEAVRRSYKIDERRIELRGFSMGGAGSWHIGLHYPDRWCSVGPGAGFTDTKKYQKISQPLSKWQEATLHIYDAQDYAMNAWNVPVVAYGGEDDPQLAASQRIREALEDLGVTFKPDGLNAVANEIPFLFLVGPKTEHQFHPESRKRAMEFHASHASDGVPFFKDRLRFITYTVKYPGAFGFRIRRMDRHYEPASLDVVPRDGRNIEVHANNVRVLEVSRGVANEIQLGADRYDLNTAAEGKLPTVLFERRGDRWEPLDYSSSLGELGRSFSAKRPGLQGPIDDAFTDSFLCVRGSGEPWAPALTSYASWTLDRFTHEWDKYMRGHLPIKDDSGVTEQDIRDNNLILFGDPGSNRLIQQIVERLPFKWTRDAIQFGNQSYDSHQHVAVCICPNPLNARKYVVINSGHTFHETEFKASNAQLYPRLGDYAVLRCAPANSNQYEETVVQAGIFDEGWNVSP